jgi:phage gpG-like protein
MGIMKLAESAARFAVAAAAEKAAEQEALESACELIETRAKNYIGAPHGWWAPLKPETLRRKDGINTPLLESGEMRDSIEHTVHHPSGFVGSNSDIAVYQELGTSRGIPPRSFLGHAASESGEDVAKIVGATVAGAIGAALGGSSVLAAIEALRFVGEAFKPIKDLGEDLVTPDEKKRR